MANVTEMSETLLKRFKDVPNVDISDAADWIERAMLEHGYNAEANVPQSRVLLVLLYAEWDACMQLALNAAYYFEYKDSEETVDKRAVSEQYRRMAIELKKRYDAKKLESEGGTNFKIMTRVDRR